MKNELGKELEPPLFRKTEGEHAKKINAPGGAWQLLI